MMKAKIIFYLIFLTLIVPAVNANEKAPVVISPGIETGVAIVAQSSPTFSWTAVDWAVGYRVEVFNAVDNAEFSYEELAAISYPVLTKEIPGAATSWTPSSEERLSNGVEYVWYVQALDANSLGTWSKSKSFVVNVTYQFGAIEERLSESLQEFGVGEDIITDVLKDVKETMVQGLEARGISDNTQDKIGIQGTEGATNTFYGLNSGFSISGTGDFNNFFGRSAGYSTSTGDRNTFIGYYAGSTNSTGVDNIFIGFNSGSANSTGGKNTFLGNVTGFFNTGSNNTFLGHRAGYTNSTGGNNLFIGVESGYMNSTGAYNTFIGTSTGLMNSTGSHNTFLGYQAGNNNTGSYNTFLGKNSGKINSSGAYNTFIGYNAGYNNTASYNTFIGRSAGFTNTSGTNNTVIGYNAGYTNSTGSGNVSLGYNAGYNETGSNKLYIDNSDTSYPLIYGDFSSNILAIKGKLGIGTKNPAYPMHLLTTGTNAAFVLKRTDGAINYINATAGFGNFGTVNDYPLRLVANGLWRMRLDSDNSLTLKSGATCTAGGVWTDASSRELKENIRGLTADEAKDALENLNPVRFNYKADQEEESVGFIAEDVPDLVATKGRKGLSPMDVVAVLTKVLQEQQKANQEQQKANQEQQKVNKEQQKAYQVQLKVNKELLDTVDKLSQQIAKLKRK